MGLPYRILLDAYRQQGKQALLREELNAIPELYFTKLELKATLLDGDEAYEAALDQKGQSLGLAIEMLLVIVWQLHALGNDAAARQQLEMAKAIHKLPDEGDIKQMKGQKAHGCFRLRVGDYRVIYSVDHGKLVVYVVDAGNRGEICKRY